MRPVLCGGHTSAERWSRLGIGLTASIMVHCAALGIALGFVGATAFRPLPQPADNRSRLAVSLLPDQRFMRAENTLRRITPPGLPSGVAAPPEPQPPSKQTQPQNNPPAASPSNGLFPGPWYYPARYLHRRPSPLKPIWPEYPPEAQTLSGQIVLLLMINEKGGVDSYRIVESQPPGVFDDAVINAFSRETYAPGLITGYQVKSQLLVEIIFEPGALPQTSILPGLPQ